MPPASPTEEDEVLEVLDLTDEDDGLVLDLTSIDDGASLTVSSSAPIILAPSGGDSDEDVEIIPTPKRKRKSESLAVESSSSTPKSALAVLAQTTATLKKVKEEKNEAIKSAQVAQRKLSEVKNPLNAWT